ncbi:MAG: AgmX/PglI C-terminal domain-containing protein [Bdellovibrionales bacterium]|nr:AgmX/PglI C-terminal domain-containing protein [Bdellovibrionales bacterium]
MGRPELFLEHTGTGTQARRRRVTSRTPLYVIGSSKEADLRLAGKDVAGCHAVLQYRDSHWYIRSVSLDGPQVKLNNEPVIEAMLDEKAEIEIGEHRIKLFSKERTDHFFHSAETMSQTSADRGPLAHHLAVVVDHRGRVLSTHVLDKTQALRRGDKVFVAPTSAEWVETDWGTRKVRQRLITAQEAAAAEGVRVDQDLKKPMIAALLLLLFMVGSVWFMPKAPDSKPELALDQKSIDMIFNAEAIKKKRQESKKVTQTAKLRAGGSANAPSNQQTQVAMPDQSMSPVKSEKATQALTSIRNAGLSALVGKIAKRANKNGLMIAAQGVSPDVKGSGRAFFSNGTSTTGGGGAAAVAGDTYRLGGVATKGKGGGATGVRDGTALAGGTVGTGDVAMVDEETVIEGGLDRDVIADVIRRNLGQIRYCYERQLSSNPDLYGKLLVRFTIDAGGGVMDSKIDTSTLKSSLVEGCVLRRMAGWKFPLPKGGTQVRVSYPFLFKALD